MRLHRAALVIACAGLVTFGAVFLLLEVVRSATPPAEAIVVATVASTPTDVVPVARATDSLAPRLAPGRVAVGVPSTGSEPLLEGVQPGDRVDVMASLPSPEDGRPVTAVVVDGAMVVRPATASDPLLLEVTSQDALVLAHLVLSETRLTFVVWSSAGRPPAQQPLDERTARGVLGLPTLVTAAVVQPTPTPIPAPPPVSPTPTAAPVLSAPTYTVQAGESMDSIAARLGVDPGALWWANRSDLDPLAPLVAGARLRLPPVQGFLYEIQPGDTWDSVATTFGASAAVLRLRNDMSADASLPTAGLVFIPRPT